MMNKVVIIDYGIGNIFSVNQAFKKIGVETFVTSNTQAIEEAKHLVLPGVGAFHKGMQALHDLELHKTIIKTANKGVPLIGICLGMQMLLDESDEFKVTKGLGLISGRVEKFPKVKDKNNYIKVPQINWHEIAPGVSNISWKNSLLKEHKSRDSLYFVHSFVAKPSNIDHVLANYNCNGILIPALIIKDNVVGCQFHPEKSGDVGLKILKNFMLM
jgi:glutamine amidotransferase